MKLRQYERYVEDCRRRGAFEAAQMERFHLMQEHMTTQDGKFDICVSYVMESLMSMRNEMDVNHVTAIARINHMISTQNENHHHYAQFYREMCEFLDFNYGNDGQGCHMGVTPMPRGRGR